jgi:hypothetical protein
MSLDPDWSERAQLAQRLADTVFAQHDCLERLDELVRSAASTLNADVAALAVSTDRQLTVSVYKRPDLAADNPALNRGAETAFEDTIGANALRSESDSSSLTPASMPGSPAFPPLAKDLSGPISDHHCATKA